MKNEITTGSFPSWPQAQGWHGVIFGTTRICGVCCWNPQWNEDLHWNATKILRLQLLEVSCGLAGKQVLLHFSKVFVQQSLSNNFSSEISNRLYIGDCRQQCRRGIVAGGQFGLSNVNNQSGIITQGENLELPMLCLRKANKLLQWLYRGIVKDDLEILEKQTWWEFTSGRVGFQMGNLRPRISWVLGRRKSTPCVHPHSFLSRYQTTKICVVGKWVSFQPAGSWMWVAATNVLLQERGCRIENCGWIFPQI